MYHVTPMMPRDTLDSIQTTRRSYLLNDIVLVVFLEQGYVTPNEFANVSPHVHVIVTVEPVVNEFDGNTCYQMSVCSRHGVPAFGPVIPRAFLVISFLYFIFLVFGFHLFF